MVNVEMGRYKYILAIGLLMLTHITIMFLWVSSMKNEVNLNASISKSSFKLNNKETPVKPLPVSLSNN